MLKPSSPEAVRLFHEGSIAFAQVEANGMRIDTDYLDRASRKADKRIKRLEEQLRADDVYKTWRKCFGTKTNLDSGPQFAHVLFKVLKYPCKEYTDSGLPSSAGTNLVDIDLPFVTAYQEQLKWKKAKSTFLEGIRSFVTSDGLLHPNFNLNIAASFRSSSSEPNNQNFPARNEEMSKLVRSAFIPRDDHHLVESDFSGIEVGVSCCYNKDHKLIKDYVEGDMHRDMAMQCYKLPLSEMTKPIRQVGKGSFVFPQFYGSYWVDCAVAMWEAVDRQSLTTASGKSLRDHLTQQGFKRLGACDPSAVPRAGTFEAHLKDVENDFWKVRYKIYDAWKQRTWEAYKRKGFCKLHTGFVCTRNSDGQPMNRKQVINYQIQGAAFHCLLWCIVELNKWLRKNKMRSMIIGQIHDSVIGDVHKDELQDYLAKVKELMTVDLPRAWKWIIVPLSVEMEVCKLGGNWFQKEKVVA